MEVLRPFYCVAIAVLAAINTANSASNLPPEWATDIESHRENVQRIIDYVVYGGGRGRTYERLADLVDNYGPRMTGTDALEAAINDTIDQLRAEGYDHVEGEEITGPNWFAGEVSGTILLPWRHELTIMALGSSIGTPPEGIEADVVVVRNWDELREKAALNETQGKIVVYNNPWVGYNSEYRSNGASEAAKVGGVAALVKSLATLSIDSPHTGQQNYQTGVNRIPAVSITVEVAQMLQRFQNKGRRIRIGLNMTCADLGNTTSRNTVAEIRGRDFPGQTVILGGHMDSWNVGLGAMDDAGGVIISWEAMSVMKALNLVPRRTMRSVFWSIEEQGILGAAQYYDRHQAEADNMSLVMESDSGTFLPTGIGFGGSGLARAIMEEILALLQPINTTFLSGNYYTPDTGPWYSAGVPVGSLDTLNEKYMYFHHSGGDTLDVEDPHVLDLCTALWASVAYVVADLHDILPRTGDYPTGSAGWSLQPNCFTAFATFCFLMLARKINF